MEPESAEGPTFEQLLDELHTQLRRAGMPEAQARQTVTEIAQTPAPPMRQAPGGPLEVDIGPRNALAGNVPRQIQQRALAGRDPTPEQAEYLRSVAPEKDMRSERLGMAGRELSGIPQIGRAGEALGEAYADPSIPSLTNAGVQSSLALLRPVAALKSLGLGLGAAGLKDAGALDFGASAQQGKKPARVIPGLPPELADEYAKLEEKIRNGAFATRTDRQTSMDRLKQLQDLSNASIMERNRGSQNVETEAALKKQAEYERAVATAERARDTELGRNRRFSDTETGKVWDKTGGVAPFLLGAPLGAVTRMATGGGTFMKNWGIPLGIGGIEGAAAANIPLGYNSFVTEPDNPEKRAYQAYSRELPPDHPRKAEFAAYAGGLPDENPVRAAASRELYDPVKAAERMGFGAVEGMAGALFGNKLVGATSRYGGAAANSVGAVLPSRGASKLQGEAAALERNALAGPEGVSSGVPGVRLGTEPQGVRPNPLAGEVLPPQTTSDRGSLAERVQSQRQRMPIEAAPSPPKPTSDVPPGMKADKNGVLYWEDGEKGGHKVSLYIRQKLGIDPPAPQASARQSRPEPKKPDRSEIPEKTPVQIDDLAPMGRRNRLADD